MADPATASRSIDRDIDREVGEFWQRVREQLEDFFVDIGAATGKISSEFAPFRFIRRVWPPGVPPAFSYTHFDPPRTDAIICNGGIAGTLYDDVERQDHGFNRWNAQRSNLHAYVVRTVSSSKALPDLVVRPVFLENTEIRVEPLTLDQHSFTGGGVVPDLAGSGPDAVMFWLPVYEFMRDEGFAGSFLGWLCQIAAEDNAALVEQVMSRVNNPTEAYRRYVLSWKKARRFSEQLQELALDEIRLAEVDPLESPVDFIARNLHVIHPMERVDGRGELTIELSPGRAGYPAGFSPRDIGELGGTIRLSPRVESDFIRPTEKARERYQGDVQVLYRRLYREVVLRVGYARSLFREARARAEQTVLREELHLLKNAFKGFWLREKALAEELRDGPLAIQRMVAGQRATYALSAFGLMLKQAARHESDTPPPTGAIRLDRLLATALPHAMLLVRELPREFAEGSFLTDFTSMAESLAGIENLEQSFWPSLLANENLAPACEALVAAIASRGPTVVSGEIGRCSLSGDARDFMHLYEILLEIFLNAFKRNATSVTFSRGGGRQTLVIRSSNSDELCAEQREHSWREVPENAVGGFALLRDRAQALGGRYRRDHRSRVVTTDGFRRDMFVRWDEIDLGRISLRCELSDETSSLSDSR